MVRWTGVAGTPTDASQEVYDMTLVRRTSPLGELVSLRQAMDRLFEDSFVRPRGWASAASRATASRST